MNKENRFCVLHILTNDDGYGSARSFIDLLKVEVKYGIKPVVITPWDNRMNTFCREHHIHTYVVPYEQCQIPKNDHMLIYILKYIYHWLKYITLNRKAKKAVLDIARKEKINAVHSNSSVIDIGTKIYQELAVPHIWHIREYGKEDFNLYPMRMHFIKYMNRSATKFVCISKAIAQSWEKKGLDQTKVVILSHGINVNLYKRKQQYNDDGVLKVVMVGSYSEGKGQILLLKALNKLKKEYRKKIKVDFYGTAEGKYFKTFEAYASENNLNNMINIKGYSNHISNILCEYDVGVICSRSEGMGRATLEYMISGLCPVVSNAGANIEIVKDNQCGVLFDLNDSYSLTQCLEQLIEDRHLVELYGTRSYYIAKEKFDSNINDIKMVNLLKSERI